MAISLTSSTAYTQDFNTLASTGVSSSLPADWLIAESGTSANATYTAGTGSANAGDTYSFGSLTATNDRALGGLRSGSLIPSFGASFSNNTGSSISTLNISFTGEQWRLGTAGRADRLDFQYSTDATSLTTGTWIDVNTLDFTSPATTGTAGLRDGNDGANRTALSENITGLSISNGSNFWIRWTDSDATGADDGLAVDNFSLTPVLATVAAGVSITQSGGNTSVAEGGATDTYDIKLNTQPTSDVTVSLAAPGGQLNLSAPSFTFTSANWNTAQTATVSAVDDSLVEANPHTSNISHTVSSTDSNYNSVTVPGISVSIADNDIAAPTITKIHAIQGSGTSFDTAFGGSRTIEGVVVGDFKGSTKLNGFYLQEEDADADTDAATSEGIFVFDPTGLFTGTVGSKVRVTGTVGEFATSSTGIAGTANSSLTQLSGISNLVNSGNVALPTVTNIVLPVNSTTDLERYEGTLVNISAGTNPLTVTETFKLGRFGQVGLSAGGRIDQFTQSNAPSVTGYSNYLANLQDNYIILDDGSGTQNPDPTIHARGGQPLSATNTLRGGDTIASISGVLDERFEGFRVQTTTPANFSATNAREASAPVVGGNLKVASFNLLNFFNGNGIDATSDGLIDGGFPTARGANNAAELKRQLDKTVQAVLGLDADILGYNEIENDGYGANSAVQGLVNALNAATTPGTYAFVTPPATALDADGKFGGDEIAVGFIYKTSAARVAPGTNPAALTTGEFAQDNVNRVQRPALAVTFEKLTNGTPTNQTFTAVANHFKSKGSSAVGAGNTDAGDGQGLSNGTRTRASQQLATWLATNPTGTSDSDYLIMGDLNAYRLEDPITTLTNAGYNSLFDSDSYSYQFNGQWGSLDHALANGNLNSQVTGAAKWHINSDEPTVLDYNTEFKTAGQVSSFYNVDPFRSSDHDPIVVGLNLGTLNGGSGNDTLNGGTGNDILRSGGGNNILNGGAGNDVLFSSLTGIDNLTGGAGDDVYEIHNTANTIVENSGGGTDTIWTDTSYTMSANIETMYLVGDINGTGSAGDNTIVVYGGGTHTIDGAGGNDTLIAGTGTDTLIGGGGNDVLLAGAGTNSLEGGAGNDVLFSSLTGLSTLTGGADDDVYEIHNPANTIVEAAGGGNDTIWTSTTYTMSANIETMYLVGNINGTGSDDDNTIVVYGGGNHTIDGAGGNDTLIAGTGTDTLIGGGGNDVLLAGAGTNSLEGGAGNDVLFSSLTGLSTLAGGAGDDVYEMHNSANTIVEGSGDGTDTVWTDVSYTLADNVETLVLVGNINGIGSAGDNTIVGYGSGTNVINGGAGNDTLYGGAGSDVFVFDSSSLVNAVISGIDTIGDFTFNQDKIRLDRAVFQSLYDITEENFSLITNDLMTGSESGGIFYNTDNGRLFYTGIVGDSDIFTTTQFAQLGTGLNLTATDFTVDNSLLI